MRQFEHRYIYTGLCGQLLHTSNFPPVEGYSPGGSYTSEIRNRLGVYSRTCNQGRWSQWLGWSMLHASFLSSTKGGMPIGITRVLTCNIDMNCHSKTWHSQIIVAFKGLLVTSRVSLSHLGDSVFSVITFWCAKRHVMNIIWVRYSLTTLWKIQMTNKLNRRQFPPAGST